MRPTGEYATFHGTEYAVVPRGEDQDGSEYVGLLLDDAADVSRFERIVERQSGELMAKVNGDELDRYEQVTTVGYVDGVDVTLYGLGDVVPCSFVGDRACAESHGFTGSQHDGWSGDVPYADITDIHETVRDLLHPARVDGST